jgi:hypothetical protein
MPEAILLPGSRLSDFGLMLELSPAHETVEFI